MLRIAKRTLQAVAAAGALTALSAAPTLAAAGPIGSYTTKGALSYVSEPNLHPPALHPDRPVVTKQLAGGYFLVDNFPNLASTTKFVGQSGPMILDRKLNLVWFDPDFDQNTVTDNLEQQKYQGKPVLTWWQGVVTNTGATTSGHYVVVGQNYKQIATLAGDTQDGWVLSLHDMIISGNNAWVTAYKTLNHVDLSAYGGSKDGSLLDSAVQEYDLKSGKLLYSWDAYNPGGTPNISLSESKQPPPANGSQPWDAYHINSIELTGNGDFLTSMRNTWTAYLVNKASHQIVWRLGGNKSNFSFGSGAAFEWQHDVQLNKGNLVTVFDDHCCEILPPKNGIAQFSTPDGPSRGLVLALNTSKHTATLVHQYLPPKGNSKNAAFLGSTALFPNGNVLVGWGSTPWFTEYTNTGKLLMDVRWPGADLSYRAEYSSNWVGKPSFAPSGAARSKGSKSTVYASWDGATQVVKWRVLAGSNAKHLTAVATRAKGPFETQIPLAKKYAVYKVQALDAKGHVLGTSKAFGVGKATAPKTSGGSSGGSGSGLVGFY
jgi:hypothetical protein